MKCKFPTKEACMMGHREKLKNGSEHDLAGHPQWRWRSHMSKRHKKWSYWKNQINRRLRRQAKQEVRRLE